MGNLLLLVRDKPNYKPYWGLIDPQWCTIFASCDHVQAFCYQVLETDNAQTMRRLCLYILITDVLHPHKTKQRSLDKNRVLKAISRDKQ